MPAGKYGVKVVKAAVPGRGSAAMDMSSGIGKEFMIQTYYENMDPSPQRLQVAQPPLEAVYDRMAAIQLPPPEEIPAINIDFLAAVELRTSVRDYQPLPFSLLELSFLLWCTQGVKQVVGHGQATLRNVPSAGARHALETYLLINRVEGLQPGLYRFAALEHQLVPIDLSPEIADAVTQGCLGQKFVASSAVTFLWAADAQRMTWRYGERGYRYLHLDAGHVCQNLYLAAQVIGGGVCAIAAFNDQLLNEVLKLDGQEQFMLYAAAAGKR